MSAQATTEPGRAVFLDRDGVINEPPPAGSWVFRWDNFRFADGALDALRRLREAGFVVAVITNQSCVGRGLASLADIEGINRRMVEAVASAGGSIAGVYLCPHTNDDGCLCRKPRPGLIDQAARELGVAPERSFVVGDSERDIEAGLARGCRTLRVTGPNAEPPAETRAHHVVRDLAEAVELILDLVHGGEREPVP